MDQKFFEDAREMFMSQGWKDFVAAKEEDIAGARIENIADEKSFWMAKGSLHVLHQIVGFENYITLLEAQEAEDA